MCLGDRDRGADIDAGRDQVGMVFGDPVAPRVERNNTLGIGPLRVRADVHRRRGVREIGAVVALQIPRSDCQRAVPSRRLSGCR